MNMVWDILNQSSLGVERIDHPKYPADLVSQIRDKTYREVYDFTREHKYYDFKLVDNSLLQFRLEQLEPFKASYCYYDSPYIPPLSFDDFIAELGIDIDDLETARDLYYNMTYPDIKESAAPLRYDYNTKQYTEGQHPASHIHIGIRTRIRIRTQRILRPSSFVLFVIRQSHPVEWLALLKHRNAMDWCKNVRDSLPLVGKRHTKPLDDFEMALG